mmetsp:Transcript_21687/g.15984  ORF Transcript_21687/g.15984 Transcript_21687/m.15984 type:complete len:134 (-) Transcript_21687:806-1207(-)
MNHVLFRCENEERDISQGNRGPYGFNSRGVMKYAGISSFMHHLRKLKVNLDMGDEIFGNMREGNWLLDYVLARLKSVERVGPWVEAAFGKVRALPPTYKPKFGAKVIEKLYRAVVWTLVKDRLQDPFIKGTHD